MRSQLRLRRSIRHRSTGILVGLGVVAAGIGMAAAPFVRHAHTTHPVTKAALTVPGEDRGATLLFNGWRIRPTGRHIPTGDMPLGGAISPDVKTYAICSAGFDKHALHLIDIATEKEIAVLPVVHTFYGIVWSPDGTTITLSGGVSIAGNDLTVFSKKSGTWAQERVISLTGNDRKRTCLTGLALSADGKILYTLNSDDDNLYIVDAADGATLGKMLIGDHPGICKKSADGKRLYILNWGGSEAVVLDISVPTKPQIVTRWKTGAHPNDIALGSDGRAFISCGNADAVDIFDAATGRHLETVKTTLTPHSPSGSTPDALAISPDNKTLYVANADNNDVCVIDVFTRGSSHVRGFIPTGWYPTSVMVTPDGKRILIGSGKGVGAKPNPSPAPIDPVVPKGFEYIGKQLNGLLSFVNVPTKAQLVEWTKQVYADAPYKDSQLRDTDVVQNAPRTILPTRVGAGSPIKHILYIIKENRTYDQVFGDMKRGNGDASLTLFGRDVTPNHHAIADQFVLLDNIYCNGEVSVDGHSWCDAAMTTDYKQRQWILSYSGKGEPAGGDSVETPAGGYIWDACRRNHLSYRSYGESFDASSSEAAPVQKVEGEKGLIGHGSAKFVGVGWNKKTEMRDMDKADVFIEELKAYERTKTVPNFMVMSLGEDHTSGTRPGSFTPKASVASNDVALGRIVEAVSHSSIWEETAIFVIEDDAQNGPDHVDSHRTVALVISPYTRRRAVDSTMYTTASMLRTMELLLGLPPLTQYDAAATPMTNSFMAKADLTPYTPVPPKIDLMARNPNNGFGASASAKMDFRGYDRADPDTLNAILWHSIKGRNAPLPAPVHRALTTTGRLAVTLESSQKDRD